MSSQIKGLNQAIRNANDGMSLIGTAESAIEESQNILQRLRELAIQSSNDTNTASDRSALQDEVSQLLSEVNRIGNNVTFNGQKLLDGTFSNKSLQIGAESGQTMSITIGDLRATKIGAVASHTSSEVTAALSSSDVKINGVSLGDSSSDGISYADASLSSIAVANAINALSGQTGVTAAVEDTVFTGAAAVEGGVLDNDETLVINGITVGNVTYQANDSDSALRNAINAVTNSTGVVASLDSSNKVVLTADDGRNITITTTGTDGTDATGKNLGLHATANLSADTTHGTYTLTSDSTITVSGADVADVGLSATSYSVDLTTAISSVDISTQSGAQTAIDKIDFAISQVNDERAGLGALTNRLSSTVSNLSTVVENLSASNSQIVDADFAAETAMMTRNQILQQAGTAILAQANQTPQAALSLLR
jgi:flagellin